MRPDSHPRLWRYINLLLTYLLTYLLTLCGYQLQQRSFTEEDAVWIGTE